MIHNANTYTNTQTEYIQEQERSLHIHQNTHTKTKEKCFDFTCVVITQQTWQLHTTTTTTTNERTPLSYKMENMVVLWKPKLGFVEHASALDDTTIDTHTHTQTLLMFNSSSYNKKFYGSVVY